MNSLLSLLSFHRSISLLILLSWTLFPVGKARTQDLPAGNTATLLKTLDQTASIATNKIQSRRAAALAQIQSACGSGPEAVNLYLHGIQNTQYRTDPIGYATMQRKNQGIYNNPTMQNAALLQMRYLALALRRTEQHDAYAQIAEVEQYLDALVAANFLADPVTFDTDPADTNNITLANTNTNTRMNKWKKIASSSTPIPEAQNLLKSDLSASPVVQWIQISDLLPRGDDFATSAGDYEGILEKNIRVSLRKKNDQRLLSTWDLQIKQEMASATATANQQQADFFNQTRMANLLFKKAQDTAAIGQPNRAIAEIMQLIQAYPGNPSVKDWTSTARGLLTNPPLPIAASNTVSPAIVTAPEAAPVVPSPLPVATPAQPPLVVATPTPSPTAPPVKKVY